MVILCKASQKRRGDFKGSAPPRSRCDRRYKTCPQTSIRQTIQNRRESLPTRPQTTRIKRHITNIPATLMPASEIISSYHGLWHVEQSFRMSKNDLKVRPIFHHQKDAIETHLTIVMTALAISRYLYQKPESPPKSSSESYDLSRSKPSSTKATKSNPAPPPPHKPKKS